MTSDTVVLGENLIIPDTSATTYTVKSGDNLYNIAKDYGVSVSDIKNANGLTSDVLMIGDELVIPGSFSDPSFINYSISKGDNLYDLAKRYNTTVDAIKGLNNITSDSLDVGEVIKIPTVLIDDIDTDNQNYIEYTVKSGDNLYSIAENFGVSVDDLKMLNKLDDNNLTIGEVLLIGNYEPNQLMGLSCYGNDNDNNNFITYIVKAGDDLYSIANEYNTSVKEIMNINDLDSDSLSVGQILKIKENV